MTGAGFVLPSMPRVEIYAASKSSDLRPAHALAKEVVLAHVRGQQRWAST
jgi:hypothetical protein